jgi:hypothetical protein
MVGELQIEGALHSKSLARYFEGADGNLGAECGRAPQAFDTMSAALRRPKFHFALAHAAFTENWPQFL